MPAVLLFGGGRAVRTPAELGCTAFDAAISSTYSLATAKANAQFLQEYIQAAATNGRAVVIPPGTFYAVADHDEDDFDIWIEEVSGLELHMSGTTLRQVPGDEGDNFGTKGCESGLIHVDDGTATYHTFDGSTTELTTAGASATVTVVGETVQASDVGAMVRITGGTNFLVDFYEITNYDLGNNTWTLDRTCTTGAGDAGTGWMRTRKSVFGLCNFRSCNMSLNIRGGNETLSATAGDHLDDGVTAFDGVRLLHESGQSPSGKSSFAISASQCQTAVDIDSIGVEQGPDNLEFSTLYYPDCKRGLYCNTPQAVDIVVEKAWNGGNAADSTFDFSKGGDFVCRYAYAPSGRILRVREGVSGTAADYWIHKIKVDEKIKAGVTIVDCEATSVTTNISIGGSISDPDDHQFIKIARPLERGTGLGTDCQVRIKNLGTEARAYPMRPFPGQEVPLSLRPKVFSSTKFWLDPTAKAHLTPTTTKTLAGWTVDNLDDLNISVIPDASGTSNDLAPTSGTTPAVAEGGINCIDAIELSGDSLRTSAAPTGLTGSLTGLTVMAVVRPTSGGSGTEYIVAHTDADGTAPGWSLRWVVASKVFSFNVNGTVATSTATLKLDRSYLVIGTWTADAAPQITVNAADTAAGSTVASFTAGAGVLMVGAQQNGASGQQNTFRGRIGPIFIDNTELTGDDLTHRVSYLRQWAVW